MGKRRYEQANERVDRRIGTDEFGVLEVQKGATFPKSLLP